MTFAKYNQGEISPQESDIGEYIYNEFPLPVRNQRPNCFTWQQHHDPVRNYLDAGRGEHSLRKAVTVLRSLQLEFQDGIVRSALQVQKDSACDASAQLKRDHEHVASPKESFGLFGRDENPTPVKY